MDLTRAQASEVAAVFNKIGRLNLDYETVAGKQIISAFLREIDLPDGASGYLYQVLQGAANEARRRGLLVNPNPYARETYSTAVGNTARMKPSKHWWEMTKGILSRHIVNAHKHVLNRLLA